MDIDRPSLAAAALHDLKNEQLQLANAALHQQQHQQQQAELATTTKSQDVHSTAVTTADSAIVTANGTQQYSEGAFKRENEEKEEILFFVDFSDGIRS